MIEEALRKRRSVRRFRPDRVPEELVTRLIEGAVLAPSASNKQPWKFLLLENRDLIASLAHAVRTVTQRLVSRMPESSQAAFATYGDYFTRFESAPLVIVPICKPLGILSHLTADAVDEADRDAIRRLEHDSGLIGTSLALQNLLLLAEELGLGASGMTGPLVARSELKRLLEIPDLWDIVALVPVGFPDEVPAPTARKPAAQVMRWFR
jgi:nitroreductase